MVVEIGDRAGLAEMLYTQRPGAMSVHRAKPAERRRMAVEHRDDAAMRRHGIQQSYDFHLVDGEPLDEGTFVQVRGEPEQRGQVTRVDAGVATVRFDQPIDWDRLEWWCRSLQERAGLSYYQEQALTAMLVAGQACDVAPRADYVALPTRDEVARPSAAMHHYVAESKEWYFRYGWSRALAA